MIVCVCRRVSDQQIRQAVAEGAVSLECLQFDLGVATQCGRCADCACKVLDDAKGACASGHAHGHPAAAAHCACA
jgi:bacterioferritin-associated ferredoxin